MRSILLVQTTVFVKVGSYRTLAQFSDCCTCNPHSRHWYRGNALSGTLALEPIYFL